MDQEETKFPGKPGGKKKRQKHKLEENIMKPAQYH